MKKRRCRPYIDKRWCAIGSATTLRDRVGEILGLVERMLEHQWAGRWQLLERYRREILPNMAGVWIGAERTIGICADGHARIAGHQWIPIIVRQEVLVQEIRRLHQLHPCRRRLRGLLVQAALRHLRRKFARMAAS